MFGFFEKAPAYDPSQLAVLDIDDTLQSNVPGLYVIGDLTGYPLIKSAINQGVDVVDRLAPALQAAPGAKGLLDLIIVGAGCAGLSAALRAHELGLSFVVLEQGKIANTIANFPDAKLIFDEPKDAAARGRLYIQETTKEDILERWLREVREAGVEVRTQESVTAIRREQADRFVVETPKGAYVGRRVLLAIGRRGNPRKLGVEGEDLPKVCSELHSPDLISDRDILVVGGGDAAAETALALCGANRVTMAVAANALARPKPANRERVLGEAAAGRLDLRLGARVKRITEREAELQQAGETVVLPNDYTFTMLGADPPITFLAKLGVRLRGAWTKRRVLALSLWSLFVLALYLVHAPQRFAAAPILGRIARSLPGGWYGMLYTILVGAFGLHILMKPRARHVRFGWYINLRTASAMFFQVFVYFVLPVFVLHDYRVVQLFHSWPLTIGTLTPDTHAAAPWVFWAGMGIAFVAMPVLVYFFGKRFCSFICGCGALAETFGDSTRDLSPKGALNRKREAIIYAVLIWAAAYTVYQWARRPLFGARGPAALEFIFGAGYGLAIEWLWAGVIGVAAYFFFGNRIWCRYGCPLAILMNLYGKVGLKSRFKIVSNDKCIDCGQCNRYCQMGIDVKRFAIQKKPLTLEDTPCIGCGECIAVCPMDVLSFRDRQNTAARNGDARARH